MEMKIFEAQELLQRTPVVLNHLLRDLPEEWVRATEGNDTWSCYDVVGHLIHGGVTDWLPRVRMVLEYGASRSFEPHSIGWRSAEMTEPSR